MTITMPPYNDDASNERILKKVAEKSYIPTNQHLLEMLRENPRFKVSLSITGTVIEQLDVGRRKHCSHSKSSVPQTVEIVRETLSPQPSLLLLSRGI